MPFLNIMVTFITQGLLNVLKGQCCLEGGEEMGALKCLLKIIKVLERSFRILFS